MTGALQDLDGRVGKGSYVPIEEVHPGQSIPGALEEQHRSLHDAKPIDPQLLGSSRRMKRVGVQNHASCLPSLSGQVQAHTTAHRAASEEHPSDPTGEMVGGGTVYRQKPGLGVGTLRTVLGVGVIEGHHGQSVPRQPVTEKDHEPMVLIGPGTVCEEYTIVSGSDDATRNLTFRPGYGNSLGHNTTVPLW